MLQWYNLRFVYIALWPASGRPLEFTHGLVLAFYPCRIGYYRRPPTSYWSSDANNHCNRSSVRPLWFVGGTKRGTGVSLVQRGTHTYPPIELNLDVGMFPRHHINWKTGMFLKVQSNDHRLALENWPGCICFPYEGQGGDFGESGTISQPWGCFIASLCFWIHPEWTFLIVKADGLSANISLLEGVWEKGEGSRKKIRVVQPFKDYWFGHWVHYLFEQTKHKNSHSCSATSPFMYRLNLTCRSTPHGVKSLLPVSHRAGAMSVCI